MDVADLADYLKEKGKNRFPDPEHVARCIQKAARASYRLSKVVEFIPCSAHPFNRSEAFRLS
jgi:hypothetical protein